MFFTFSRIHLRARYFSIAGAFIFLLWVFFVFCSSGVCTETVLTVKVVPVDATSSRRQSSPVIAFDTASYYRTIIDNNLFRPLGWRPPRPIEPYRLIGTILPRDANTPPKTIIQSIAGNKTYIVTTGEQLDAETQVVDIQPKQVTLSADGEQRTLHLPSGF